MKTDLLDAYKTALETGDVGGAVRLANLIDWVAIAPVAASRPTDTTAADYASKLTGFDYEGAILARDELKLHSI